MAHIQMTFTHPPPIFTTEDLEDTFKWIVKLRKDYSPNSDIWFLCRDWKHIKDSLLATLNDGSYQFSPLNRYEFTDGIMSLWSSKDMMALKLITKVLGERMADHIPKSCYHVKGHGGLKKAVHHTHDALPDYQYVMRSDIAGYYQSIRFDSLMETIECYVNHPILLILIRNACHRTETTGGVFYDYNEKGIPKGSPLSPLLGAIALIPLDKALGNINDVFYSRFMDDWVVLTKSKSALRKVVKLTHGILNALKLKLHPLKTFIGKISNGFNFLAYYMDGKIILPAKETIRRCLERATVLYEQTQDTSNISRPRRKYCSDTRDISLYQVNEEAPTDEYFQTGLTNLFGRASKQPDTLVKLRRYVGKWACWTRLGLSTIKAFDQSVQMQLPGISSCWIQGAQLPL